MDIEERRKIDRMCRPRGLAVFGAMSRPGAFALTIMCSHLMYGYKGEIYPIAGRGDEVLGRRIYRTIGEVEGPVDLASVSVPAAEVPAVLRACLAKGVAGATIHSSGFAESGAEGRALQQEIAEIAAQGLKVIGPNCFGIHCPAGGTTLLPGFDYPEEAGQVGMLFQSGGMANDLIHEAAATGVRFSKVISFGNGCDLDAVRILEYLAGDPETEIIAAYLEGIGEGRRFLEVVHSITPAKPVLIWKGGLTPFGGRATMSHTGSLGGEAEIWRAALRQAGAVVLDSADELMDTLTVLSFIRQPGRSISIMGGGGAIGVHAADLAFSLGLEVPAFQADTRARLQEILPTPGAGLGNPLDMLTPALPINQVLALAQVVAEREPVDVILAVSLVHPIDIHAPALARFLGARVDIPAGQAYFDTLLQGFTNIRAATGKEFMLVIENRGQRPENLETEGLVRQVRLNFQKAGIPVFARGSSALGGLANAVTAHRHLRPKA